MNPLPSLHNVLAICPVPVPISKMVPFLLSLIKDEMTEEYLRINGVYGFNAGLMEHLWGNTDDELHQKAWKFAKEYQTIPWNLEKIKEHILLNDSLTE